MRLWNHWNCFRSEAGDQPWNLCDNTWFFFFFTAKGRSTWTKKSLSVETSRIECNDIRLKWESDSKWRNRNVNRCRIWWMKEHLHGGNTETLCFDRRHRRAAAHWPGLQVRHSLFSSVRHFSSGQSWMTLARMYRSAGGTSSVKKSPAGRSVTPGLVCMVERCFSTAGVSGPTFCSW